MKKLFLLAFFVNAFAFAHSQVEELIAKKGPRGLYLEHAVETGQGLFAIGRLYNVNARTIAAYNNWDISKGLSVGQVLMIPLTDTNFNQKIQKGTPVYYSVGEGEGLYRVSVNSNKIPTDRIRQWNQLSSDNIELGQKLVVGYLVSGEYKASPSRDVVKETTVTPVQTEPKRDLPGEKEKEVVKEVIPPAVKTEPAVIQASQRESGQGYFKPYFEQQVRQKPASKTAMVTSGIFKTLSGWQDGKYYLLMDEVQPGTIIQISNPQNGKMVYAKVLGGMAGIRLNEGLGIRISNAAASVLEIPEAETSKFFVTVNY